MIRQCPKCAKAYQTNEAVCSECGTELAENGLLLEALNLGEQPTAPSVLHSFLPPAIIAVAGIIASVFHSAGILVVGAAVAVFFSLRRRSSKSRSDL